MAKILIVEDELKLRNELKTFLENNHHQVILLDDFKDVLNQMLEVNVDLILLDLQLPNDDGKELCRDYRSKRQTPIIIVTSQNDEMSELICINYGSDDFISKPYNPLILLARIENVLKRYSVNSKEVVYQDLILDLSKSVIKRDEKIIELSKNELNIFHFLLMNQGVIKSREDIINYLWGSDMFVDDNTLTVNINRLRNKLEDIGLDNVIQTKRGQGYIIV